MPGAQSSLRRLRKLVCDARHPAQAGKAVPNQAAWPGPPSPLWRPAQPWRCGALPNAIALDSVARLECRHLAHVGIQHADRALERRARVVPDRAFAGDLDLRQVAALHGRIEGELLRRRIDLADLAVAEHAVPDRAVAIDAAATDQAVLILVGGERRVFDEHLLLGV